MSTGRERANAGCAPAMDAVQRANSDRTGMPLGAADAALVLPVDVLRHNPANPRRVNRERFVFSNGQGSMLRDAPLHVRGDDLDIEEFRCFRPLGQGLANAGGRALAPELERCAPLIARRAVSGESLV